MIVGPSVRIPTNVSFEMLSLWEEHDIWSKSNTRSIFGTLSNIKVKLSAKIINDWKMLTIFVKWITSDAWQGSEYASKYVCKTF